MTSEGGGRTRLMFRMAAYWLGHGTLDMLFPPSCQLCGVETDVAGGVCSVCFGRLTPITQPFCVKCGAPQASEAYLNAERWCAKCERHPPVWDHARAAFLYDKGARDLILQLKYADRQENARFLGKRMWQAGQALFTPDCLVVPVPVHRMRLLKRRYNQAALLAWEVARLAGVPCRPDGLARTRATSRLAGFSRRERQEEMARAIVVRAPYAELISGKEVVLVDDVLTSGATATACTNALLQAGARSVSVLVAAEVPSQKEIDLDFPILETT